MLISTGGSVPGLGLAGLIVALGLFLSAFFSGAETGYMSVSRVRLRRRGRDDTPAGRRLLKQLRRIEEPILACLIGTNLSNVLLSAVATMVLTERYGQNGEWMAMILVGTLVIFFGEILPKVLFREFSEPLTLGASPAIGLAMFVLAPVRWILNGYTALLRRALPGKGESGSGGLDRRSLAALLLSNSVPSGEDRRFRHALNKYLDLASEKLAGVMRPFESVETIATNTTVAECLRIARQSGYSRLPLTDPDDGRLQGYVLVRDLLFLSPDQHPEPVPRNLRRRLLLVDRRMSPYGLFEEMRSQQRQLAVVVDPSGNPVGMITLEDLIEAVFGSLRDEFDSDDAAATSHGGMELQGKENG
jgi:magnesium and cobalt exporter, CNNM family